MREWAVIDGYNGKYEINQSGVIKNTVTGKILVPSTSKTGYQFEKLDRPNSPRKNALVHRLVADAFIPNPLKKSQVNHIDGENGSLPRKTRSIRFMFLGKLLLCKGDAVA